MRTCTDHRSLDAPLRHDRRKSGMLPKGPADEPVGATGDKADASATGARHGATLRPWPNLIAVSRFKEAHLYREIVARAQ